MIDQRLKNGTCSALGICRPLAPYLQAPDSVCASQEGILHRANNHAAEPDSGSEGDEDGTLQPASSAKSNSVTSGSPTRRCTAGSYDLRRHV